jgi:hypothetical protein
MVGKIGARGPKGRLRCGTDRFENRMSIPRTSLVAYLLAHALILAFQATASASVHTYYEVQQQDSIDGFSASWLHAATSGLNGSPENGALLNGAISSRLAGSFEGDLSGNVLSNISGSVNGRLKQLASYLNGKFPTSLSTSDQFELRLGGLADGGKGALAFETNGAGTGEFTGGFMDFSLFVDGNAASLLDGTFFFKPQAESGSDKLSPNRGTSYTSSLWGFNWMHDGAPVDGGPTPDWTSFLSNLGYTGPTVLRTPAAGPALESPLGIALDFVDPPPSAPEPTGIIVWGLLAAIGLGQFRPRLRSS